MIKAETLYKFERWWWGLWFNRLLALVADYPRDRADFQKVLDEHRKLLRTLAENDRELTEVMRRRTQYHIDGAIHRESPATIVLVGRYRGTDYVEVFSLGQGDFENLLRTCTHLNKFARAGRVDAPQAFRAVVGRLDGG